jgi:hypothetical protein
MKFLLSAVILSLTVSGSALANTGTTSVKTTMSAVNNTMSPAGNGHIYAVKTVRPSDDPSFKGSEHFAQRFPQATNVDYKVKGQFTEVNFIWNGLRLQAYYDGSGNPVATSRFIEFNNLPLSVQMNLKKEYPSSVVTEAVEFTDASDDGLSYYVNVVGPKVSYLLHVSTSGTISVFKKMKQ